jgi:hypothetical protein
MLGPNNCLHCGRPLTDAVYSRRYHNQGCFEAAKRRRDRDRKRDLRGARAGGDAVDPAEFMPRDPPSRKIPDIQPRAYRLVQDRSAEYIRSIQPQIENGLSMYCFMHGYNELDRQEILKHLLGETRVAPEEIPPDPPVEDEPALIDPFDD